MDHYAAAGVGVLSPSGSVRAHHIVDWFSLSLGRLALGLIGEFVHFGFRQVFYGSHFDWVQWRPPLCRLDQKPTFHTVACGTHCLSSDNLLSVWWFFIFSLRTSLTWNYQQINSHANSLNHCFFALLVLSAHTQQTWSFRKQDVFT